MSARLPALHRPEPANAREAILRLLPRHGMGVEIGVFAGDFAQRILDVAVPRRLILCDPWVASDDPAHAGALYADGSGHDMDALHDCVRRRFADRIAAGQVEVLRAPSTALAGAVPDGALDFAHIDGDHRYAAVRTDIDLAAAKVRPGGIVALDDYHDGGWWGTDVIRAVHDALAAHGGDLRLALARGDQIALRRT